MSKMQKIILAVFDNGLPTALRETTGCVLMEEDRVIETLKEAGGILAARGQLEENESFRQVIPYIVVRRGGEYASYRRGEAGGEGRLHGKVSIGFGGHVDLGDVDFEANDLGIHFANTLVLATCREWKEEVTCFENIDRYSMVGLITAQETHVDRVHIGVLVLFELGDETTLTSNEPEVTEIQWQSKEEILALGPRLETWSRLALEAL